MAGGLPTATNNQAISNVGKQGWDDGGAVFSRLEGLTWDKGVIYFTATQGGGDAGDDRLGHLGRVARRPASGGAPARCGRTTPSATSWRSSTSRRARDDLHLPDNVTASPRGHV